MPHKNLNPRQEKRKRQRGQAMVESALVLLLFLSTLIAVLDFSQLLFTQQMLVERTRSALRWGMIHAWDGSGDSIANIILFNQSTARPDAAFVSGFMGLKRANISVTYTEGTVANPNDARLRVAIVDYQYRFITPYLAKSFANNNAVVQSAPMLYR